jgi:RNA polymerase sigma-70 factor (ECF subfamily)
MVRATKHSSAVVGSRVTPARSSGVVPLAFGGSDRDIVQALRSGKQAGGAAIYDRYHQYVRRVLTRVLGPDAQLHDLIQDVFLAAIDSIDRLEDPDSLRSWLAGIAVFRARGEIRRRTRQRWLASLSFEETAMSAVASRDPLIDEVLCATYEVMDKLPADERIAFALRYVEGMELVEVAEVTQVSLATIKRRLRRAQQRFGACACRHPALRDWVGGLKWT